MTTPRDRVYRAARRMLAQTVPSPVFDTRKIMVVGLPRSGTSWLAKGLSLSPGVSYYFEPDHHWPTHTRYIYLPSDQHSPELHALVRKALEGRVRDEYAVAELDWGGLLKQPLAKTVLTKFVRLPLAVDWLDTQFPQARIAQIIRHPVPLILSWQARGWRPDRQVERLLAQKPLMSKELKPYRFAMTSAEGYWEKAAAFWAATTVRQLNARRPGNLLVQHEWLCQAPQERFGWLYDQLGLEKGEDLSRFLNGNLRKDAGPGYGRWRDPRSEIHKWKDQIDADALRQVKRVAERFELPVYRELDPEDLLAPGKDRLPAPAPSSQASLAPALLNKRRWRASA
ncbi:MAG: sulfotransferase [Chromatiales bacterium]|nr:sulfotransferase [Chromatiales bacterium]